ncbi:glutamine--fructose-6-phosphate transaminase (isomerizing) [Candidatus Parcubacteria bacterium]|nr:MAG: glutamine--fructose-6-phosphate transaminase (isomerizing) [Candidatus Parcubacteria bacterium]
MCGIFGYVGDKRDATEAVMEGLRRLDYRGYDSWGVAVLKENEISVEKQVGIVAKNRPVLPEATIGIGHTRWATHGKVSVPNAHPHYSTDKSFVLCQNGIVENVETLKKMLIKKGYEFISETDTEVIVRLVEEKRKKANSLEEAVRLAFKELGGRNTVIVLADNGDVIAARNGSPLVLGISKNEKELYFSSDVFSFAPHVENILVLNNGDLVVCRDRKFEVFAIASGKKLKPVWEKNKLKDVSVDKKGHEHFMAKEIEEAPSVIRQVVAEEDAKYKKLAAAVKKARTVYCIGSGTAGAAAAQTAYYLRTYGKINAKELIGAEAHEYVPLVKKGDLFISPSQSGETADVLEVLEHAKVKKALIASHVNMPGSMMTRMSDFPFMANAGPEICVMSTKIFVSQIAWGYLVAKAVQGKLAEGKKTLLATARTIDKMLANKEYVDAVKHLAHDLSKKEHIFLLGKGQNLQIIKEGMVKMIEGSYRHAHAIPAGDLKHYAITLMEEGVPVIVAVSNDDVKHEVLNAVHEVSARGAHVYGLSPENHDSFKKYLHIPDTGETSGITTIIPLQLLAYHMAVSLGNNVDKPRNIAKSVTVK